MTTARSLLPALATSTNAPPLAKKLVTRSSFAMPLTSSTTAMTYRRLRVMIVDDNQINLSVLSTLLKRRFGDVLDGPPISVDSGLKAIQLLRTQVFDLILMDIQMPFLSGLDATLRIRAGEDGVLEANRTAHIVAVTTAIGDEPELAYRRAGMDGMIGKPVRFQDISGYLCPLSHEAFQAASSVKALVINNEHVMPPLPPASSNTERLFYLPADGSIRAPPPDICHGANFEQMLRAQTRASLRNSGALAVARAGTWHANVFVTPSDQQRDASTKFGPSEPVDPVDRISEEESSDRSSSGSASRSSSSQGLEAPDRQQQGRSLKQGQHHSVRKSSPMYSKRTLSLQIARELENMAESSDVSDSGSGVAKRAASSPIRMRPHVVHRVSSPSCLATSPICDDNSRLRASSPTGAVAQNSTITCRARSRPQAQRDNSTPSTSGSSSDLDGINVHSPTSSVPPPLLWDGDRRDSQTSVGSGTSDVSTDISTPANEHHLHSWKDTALQTRPVGCRPKHYFSRNRPFVRGIVEPWVDTGYLSMSKPSVGESASHAGHDATDLSSFRNASRQRNGHVASRHSVECLAHDAQQLKLTE